jgi:hypothetical protein
MFTTVKPRFLATLSDALWFSPFAPPRRVTSIGAAATCSASTIAQRQAPLAADDIFSSF